jgi:alkanesulfonate monooxygenase SsuD/methylene tetrahydromethanopterin reductase-like flavin-dependent oxidoreductase (luciferase family)
MKMDQPRQYMRSYVQTVKKALNGQPIGSFFRPRPAAQPVPVYVAAVTTESAEIGGELAEGIMPFLPARSYLTRLVEAAKTAAQRAGKDPQAVDCIVSIPTFISDDLEQARSAARYNLAFFAQLPFYRKQWRRCGFVDEVNALQEAWKKNDRRAAAALVSDRMVDEVCVFGPPSLCREQLAAFHEAGAAMPVIAVSPVNEERLAATHKALSLLAP